MRWNDDLLAEGICVGEHAAHTGLLGTVFAVFLLTIALLQFGENSVQLSLGVGQLNALDVGQAAGEGLEHGLGLENGLGLADVFIVD